MGLGTTYRSYAVSSNDQVHIIDMSVLEGDPHPPVGQILHRSKLFSYEDANMSPVHNLEKGCLKFGADKATSPLVSGAGGFILVVSANQ